MPLKEYRLYSPYSVKIYRQLLHQAKQIPNLGLAPFSAKVSRASSTANLYARHDIDTAACVHNMSLLMDVDLEFGLQAGLYFRVDDQEYSLSNFKKEAQAALKAGFEVGLHTLCYLEDNFMEAFRRETEKFIREAGFRPRSFNAHGLGGYRLDARLKFYDEIASRLSEFGYEFSDCCSQLRTYDYVIQDCYLDGEKKLRYLTEDFIHPERFLSQGVCFLILTHPCYWAS